MINIHNAVRVPYNQGANFLTVYFDFEDDNLMYAVPVPRIARNPDGNPAMTLTRYKSNEVASYGYLNMDVEVEVPEDARLAAEKEYPNKNWGQFQWVATECFMTFDLPSSPDGGIIQGQPSMYGSNRANFNMNIATEADLNSIVGAFKGQPTSSFQMEYDMTTLTRLTGVEARVTFDAEIAIEFETIYKTEKDVWGNSKKVAADVKKNLEISKAGDVEITWGMPDPSAELQARVNEWAWTTLEKAVSDAVDTAQAAATSTSPITSMDSFEQTYTENSVIEWEILSSAPLSGFTDEVWDEKIERVVDNRELAVNFGLKGELIRTDGSQVCREVKVTVKYPTKTTGNTFTLKPTESSDCLFTYTAPGDTSGGSFDPNYEYQYEVYYSDTDTYQSEWLSSRETEINIIPNALGAKKVAFVGSNIPFGDEPTQVKKVRIDFFFERPSGQTNYTQVGELTSNDAEGFTFDSYFSVALTNFYTYRFVYELNDGTVKVMNTISDFGNPNADLYLIQSLIKEQEFTLRASRIRSSDLSVDFVYLETDYVDEQNDVNLGHTFDWEVDWSGSSRSTRDDKWKYAAIDNPTGAYYKMNGDYESSLGNIVDISNVFQQADRGTFKIEPGFAYYGIKIIPTNIDWDAVAEVSVFIAQRPFGDGLSDEEGAAMILKARNNSAALNDGANFNIDISISFIEPDESVSNVDRYYTVMKALNQPNIEFYFNATYIQKEGEPRYTGNIDVVNQSSVVLPVNGLENASPLFKKYSLERQSAFKKKRRKSAAHS